MSDPDNRMSAYPHRLRRLCDVGAALVRHDLRLLLARHLLRRVFVHVTGDVYWCPGPLADYMTKILSYTAFSEIQREIAEGSERTEGGFDE